ncbi:MAG: LLM class F420-dependent oxidoreductase [Acidimicrobiales bacterium]
MELGLIIFPTDQTIDPVELGKATEDLGFGSLWFPEHSHIPTSRITPWGGRKGAPDLPDFYWRTHDQFVALAAVAAVTERIQLGTGICLVAQRDPIWTAKEVASVDRISNGRMMFGIGYGWNVEEMEDHNFPYKNRRARLRENILAMKQLWTEDEASFAGEHVNFSPSWSWPKPTQSPHPPVIMGGAAGPKTAAHIAEFCDGWMPIGGRHALDGWAEIVKACEAIGRDPKTVELSMFGAKPDKGHLDELAEKGVVRSIFTLPQGPRDEVMAAVEEYAKLVDQ